MIEVSRCLLVLMLSLAWGIGWALALQLCKLPAFLARRRTWITVVIGVGVQVGIMRLMGPVIEWWVIVCCFVASGVPIMVRSLYNEWHEERELREGMGARPQGDGIGDDTSGKGLGCGQA